MKIVVTGHEGQVARSLVERARDREGIEVTLVGRPELDLTRPQTVAPVLEACRPDIVVSAAAYTAVDQAEDEPDLAFAINDAGAGAVADAAAGLGVPIIHLSTDYVFDGNRKGAYTEDDRPAPRGVYGASKLAGEQAVAAANPRYLVIRTAWVCSPFGKNFVKTMLRLAGDRDEIAVVSDQWGNPTSALDLADGILAAASRLHRDGHFNAYGVYHLAGSGKTNWAGLARHVLATSRTCGGPHASVRDITTADYPTKARRPANSCLSTAKFHATFGWLAPQWRPSFSDIVEQLVKD
jgi:dTDP-4-dehydrorhamnose reductase